MRVQIVKLVRGFCVGLLTIMMLVSGCTQVTAATNETLVKILQAQKVVVGVLPDYAPWCSRNADGNFEGYDIDIAHALGAALAVKVELVAIEAPNRVPALVSGKVDVIIACLTPTDERAKTVSFTLPYASAGQIPMVMADNMDIKDYKDMAGKKVAIVRGGTPDLYTTKMVPNANIIRFDTIADAYTAFKSGQADAFVEEDSFVFSEVKNNPSFKAVGEAFSTELISIAIKQNDQGWLNYLNNFVINLRFSGTNAMLYEKWFGHAPNDLTLR